MVQQKLEMLVEKFPNGITVRWNGVTGKVVDKALAIRGEEPKCLGDSVWDSVYDVLNQSGNDKVEVVVDVHTL